MWTLGISAYHGDSSAALLQDGQVVAAVEEERFTRLKHWAGFPLQAVRYCLDEAGITLDAVDQIAINRDPRAQVLRKIGFVLKQRTPWEFLSDRLKNRGKILGVDETLAEAFGLDAGSIAPRIHHVEHHLAHAASAFYASPFDEAAILTVDGFGDWTSSLQARATAEGIEELSRVFFPHSLGVLYTAVTQFLGFTSYGDEYKVMGLAPYGQAEAYIEEMRQLIAVGGDGRFELNLDCFLHQKGRVEMTWNDGYPAIGQMYSEGMAAILGPPRASDEDLTQRHKDLAASLQALYEEVFAAMLDAAHCKTGSANVCISGGCAMNSVANGRIVTDSPFAEAYVPPQPGDGGGAIGAALYVACQAKVPRDRRRMSAFLGPSFTDEQIEGLLEAHLSDLDESITVTRYDDEDKLCESVAADIAAGKVIGWFQGRMEWGPRALGNRSILADPRRADMKDILNLKIKRRESFRPFAPSILREATAEFFETDYDVPYMSMVFQIRPEKRELIPAVTHVNGSGRLQTVDREHNPLYWKLIDTFGRATSVPIVLNTSFNENEPIVCTPAEALDCFLRTNMDTLALGSTVLRRTGD